MNWLKTAAASPAERSKDLLAADSGLGAAAAPETSAQPTAKCIA
jgi:hypothetical protein